MQGKFVNLKNNTIRRNSKKIRNTFSGNEPLSQPIEILNWARSSNQFKAHQAFTALKSDGSVVAWGSRTTGGGAPDLNHINRIYSNKFGFAAIDIHGNTYGWKSVYNNSNWALPAKINDNGGNKKIFSTERAFANLNEDGSVQTWGDTTGTYKSGANSTSVASKLNDGIERKTGKLLHGANRVMAQKYR